LALSIDARCFNGPVRLELAMVSIGES